VNSTKNLDQFLDQLSKAILNQKLNQNFFLLQALFKQHCTGGNRFLVQRAKRNEKQHTIYNYYVSSVVGVFYCQAMWKQPLRDRNGNAILVQVQPNSTSPTGYDFVPLNFLSARG
jgi:hypothetical protein